ncbi:MAG: hypothetical protein HOE95_02060, partial [Flavobacteriales bacterium]|nr:hypothetical protein [Flavobacteriales bacterium]
MRGIKLILAMMLSINLASAQNLTEQDWVGSTGLELSLMMESKGLHLLFSDSTLLSTRFDTEAEQIIDFLNINLNKVHLYAFEGLDCRCYVVSADPGFEVILPKKFFATQKTSETFSEDEDQNSLIRETRHTSVEQTLIIGQQGGGKSKGSCGI